MSDLAIQLPAHQDQTSFNLECWSEILADPFYAKLEQRIETDRHGHIIMTPPPSFSHGQKGFRLAKLLETHLQNGQASVEVPISTSDGVRAADVAWLSSEQLEQTKENNILLTAPEICVEVLLPRNSETEMQEKAALSFDAGATEVWLCDDDGTLRFFTAPGQQAPQSQLAPDFPKSI
ncbi:Uma2 family endonuclease [Akkermansiaceae bacterium]|jgi:Uma2 family endonuclease|nr:Uma2 family endonuclease [Akkermansiaceae bacterium]